MYRFYFPAKVPGRPWPLAVLATSLLMLSTAGPARADGDAAAGANVFNRCAACHQTGPGASNGVGPQLSGVIGRPIASVPGYDYSSGLAAFGGQVWSRDRVAQYIADPTGFIGERSAMPAQRLRPEQVADLLTYLESQ